MIRRWLFNFTAAISLVLWLTTLLLWKHSYTAGYDADWRSHDRGVSLITCTGRVFLCRYDVLLHDVNSFEGFHQGRLIPDIRWDQMLPGATYYLGSIAAGSANTGVLSGFGMILPYWLFAFATAILPACWLRNRLRADTSSGDCAHCGYNLTANTSGVCPECGAPVPGKPEITA